jgi:hypothetical protein
MLIRNLSGVLLLALLLAGPVYAQAPLAKENLAVERGSRTAKGGFTNETEIRDRFNNWKADVEAQKWLATMGYKPGEIVLVTAVKPHGEKADVEVRVKTRSRERREGISIKLVSSEQGFNQIDKRWLATYATKWKMPVAVSNALQFFVGEKPPLRPGRDAGRMFLDELDAASQKVIVDFFTANREEIVSDLFAGDGEHAAGWFMVAYKATANTRWKLITAKEAASFFGDGKVEITPRGNLKIGRITMQRKGGDGGRPTAKMLQFKINPALILDRSESR